MYLYIFLASIIRCSYYQPHVYPARGPFFEGWYMRMNSNNSPQTYGFLFGKVLPKNEGDIENPNYLSIVRSQGDGSPMEAYDRFPKDYKITINGEPVTSNPYKDLNPQFEFHCEFGHMILTEDSIEWDFELEDITFRGKGNKHNYYREDGYGPGGFVDKLPLPLHWFVFSVGTYIKEFNFIKKDKHLIEQGSGYMHMEKNWGKSFPDAWIWGQGHDQEQEVTILVAGGPLPGPVPIESFLVGYINHKKDIHIDFAPPLAQFTSTQSQNEQNCNGYLKITAKKFMQYKIEIEFQSDPKIFETCLLGPSVRGFVGMATESYETTITAKVYRIYLQNYQLIDEVTIKNSALEFGGSYICQRTNPCQTDVNENKYKKFLHLKNRYSVFYQLIN